MPNGPRRRPDPNRTRCERAARRRAAQVLVQHEAAVVDRDRRVKFQPGSEPRRPGRARGRPTYLPSIKAKSSPPMVGSITLTSFSVEAGAAISVAHFHSSGSFIVGG